MKHQLAGPVLVLGLLIGALGTAHAQLAVSPSPVAVPSSEVPTPSSEPFQVTDGSAGSDDLDVDLTAAACAPFAVDTPRIAVTTAAPATVTATYTPVVRGLVTCPAKLENHADGTVRLAFDITGTATGPALTVTTTTPVVFAPSRVTTGAIATQIVTFKNTGDDDLHVSAIAPMVGTQFTVMTGITLPATLAAGTSQSVTLAFQPTAAGTQTDTLLISSDAIGAPTTSVALTGQGTNAVISVTDVAFGVVLDSGAASVKPITISNTGALPVGTLGVTQAVLTDTSGWFAFDASTGCAGLTTCPLALAIGTTAKTLDVACDPTPNTASGAQTATVTFTSDSDPGGASTATLTCTAGRSAIVLGTPAPTLEYNNVTVGQSATLSFSVHNAGSSPLTYAIAESGASYTVTSGACTPCTIAAAGADKTISVKFTPTAIGDVTGSLTLTTNDPDPGTGSIAIGLDGTGAASQISGAPGTLPFGNVDVGKTLPLVLTIMNTGNSNLDISGAVLAGAIFTVTDGTLGAQTLAPASATTWTIACTPTVQGAKTGTFTISSDSLANPTAVVTLSCNGQVGMLAVTPEPFDFGGVRQGDTKSQTFTITNGGNAQVSGITAMLTDATLGYTITTPPPTTLAGGGTSTMVVQFAPASAADGGADQVVISGAWGTAPQTPVTTTLDLNGEDKAAGYDVSSPTLAIGDVQWNQTATGSFTIALTDATPVAIKAIGVAVDPATTMSGEITQVTLQKNGATATLPIELTNLTDVITVGMLADPADRLGPMKATVTVTSDLAMNPTRQVVVTATSVSPMVALAPATGTLAFGQVDVDGSPAVLPITLTNTGDGPLSFGAIKTTNPDNTFTFLLPASPGTVAAGASATIMVTYTPTLEENDAGTVVIPLSGIFGTADGSQTIAVTGQGINRHLSIPNPAIVFDPTFAYPTTPPQKAVHVANTGLAPLHVHMVEVTGSSVFTLVGASTAVIAGQGSNDFVVAFDPLAAGPATEGILEIDNDDTPRGQPDAVAMVTLDGLGIDRDVAFGPTTVSLGTVGIGIPRKVSDLLAPGLQVTSMDATNTFHIHAITVDDAHLALLGAPQDIDLLPGQTDSFDAEYAATDEGPFTATLSLYLDDDPNPRANIVVTGTAAFVEAQGGGGCAAGGGGAGGGALLVLAGVLATARRRRRGALAAAIVASTGATALAEPPVTPAAPAQTRNLDASVFHPTPSVSGGAFAVQTASVGEAGDFAIAATLSYADKPLDLATGLATGHATGLATGLATGATDDFAIANRTLIDLGAAYALLDRFELAAHMPLYAQSGDAQDATSPGDSERPATGTARGDLVLDAKARLWRSAAGAVQLGVAAALTLPTATADEFAGVADPEGRVLGLVSIAPTDRLALHLNAGAVLRARETYANIDQKSGVAWGAGATFRLLDALWLDGEVYGELVPGGVRTGVADASGTIPSEALDTMEALVGVRYQLERRTSLGFALGRGLDDGFGSPALRGVFSMTFVNGARALPPIHPPPPPKIDGDADGDGIPDSVDKCPNDPEDKDGFEDEDGCPDPDNDHDGIPDAQDKCPLEAEDKDGFQDEDGCPDLDNDKDGILDKDDKCPNDPEDKDGFEDGDGCPDPDNDHDGIPDVRDKCPNQPETINGIEDEDGCPDVGDPLVVISPDRLDILDSIKWNGTKLAKSSTNLLGQIAATLRAHDEILRVRVTVHVQPSGNPGRDQEISDRRAVAVRDWLVQWGIATKRLEPRGFGGTKPILAPDKRGAAALNDRMELIILERK